MRRLALVLWVSVVALGCESGDRPSPGHGPRATASAAPAPAGIRFVHAADGADVAAIVRGAADDAKRAGSQLLVYVGATWCEPCQRFHHAAERGDVDPALSTLTLLEFDLDRDKERLERAGYGSRLIPLFSVPDADGRSSSRRIEGSIKGEDAVLEITPRLRALVGR